MSNTSSKKENKPPGGRAPPETAQAAVPGLYERQSNIPVTTTPSAPVSGTSDASDKPQASSHSESTKQSEPIDDPIRETYEVPTDGSRVQLVTLSPTDPDYESPMDMTIPGHWVTWPRTEWRSDNEFTRAVLAISDEYYTIRMQMSPIVGGGVIAYQALHPGTDVLSEPYLEVQVLHNQMDRCPEILAVIKKLVVKHVEKRFQHVRIRFNFPEGVGFSDDLATPTASKAAKVYTPVLRQKYRAGADQSLETPESIRETYGSGQRPLTTSERSEYVVWREDKSCNILAKTTPVGMSIGVQDGRILDPKFGSGSCGPKFRLKNLKTDEFEKYEDGTDAYFVTSAHHAMHPKSDRLPAYPDQMGIRADGKLVVTHPTRRDWEATVFSRQDRDATYAEALDDQDKDKAKILDPATKKKIAKIKDDDLKHHKDNDPRAIVIGELFLTTGQTATRYTDEEVGPLLDKCGDPYLNDLSIIKLTKEVADDFDNVFPTNIPIPRAFAADFDIFRANPVIQGMKDFDPNEDDILIKVGRSTGISVGKVSATRKSHYVCASDSAMEQTADYCVCPLQASVSIGHFGDSGAGLYNKYGMLVALILAGHENTVETPVYIMPVQLVRAELKRMDYELHICAPGTKAEVAPSEKAKTQGKKTIGRKQGRQQMEAEAKKQFEAEKKRKAEEQDIAQRAAPDATGCVVVDHAFNGNGPDLKFQVRLPSGTKKWYPMSMLGHSWQPLITNFCTKAGITGKLGEATAGVSKLSLKGKGKKEMK